MMGDTEWALFYLSREDAEVYLKDRAAKNFTVIQAIATFWGGLERPNAYGETVFVNGDPTHPNEVYFQHVDWVVDKAESLGLYIGMLPIWSKEYVQQDRSLLDKPSYGPTIRSAIRPDKPSVVDKTSAFGYQTSDGERPRRLNAVRKQLALVSPSEPPASFDEFCRLVEQTEGVRFRDLLSRLPQRAASGDEALRTVLEMARGAEGLE